MRTHRGLPCYSGQREDLRHDVLTYKQLTRPGLRLGRVWVPWNMTVQTCPGALIISHSRASMSID